MDVECNHMSKALLDLYKYEKAEEASLLDSAQSTCFYHLYNVVYYCFPPFI